MINLNNLSVPVGWELSEVGQSYIICNHLREPISTTIRQGMQGIYPYYGPTGVLDHLDHYRVEGKYALIGEDGDHFLKYDNRPMTLLVNGKFNVNNHAHLVQGIKHSTTEWFYYFFMHTSIKPFLTRQGAGRFKLNKAALENLPILIPPIEEQRKIAEILSTWDEAIRLTQALIAGKQQRKKGLMQRLLTGQVRFPGFAKRPGFQETSFGQLPVDWQYVPIGKIAHHVSQKNIKNKDLTVLSCTKYDGLVDSLKYFGRQIFSDDISTYKVVKRGQFAYATNHIEEGSIGYQDLYDEALISPMYTVFETNGMINDSFLYRVLKTELYRHIFEISTNGTVNRRGSLRWPGFSNIRVPMPSIKEQERIAEFFNACDREIHLLQQKLAALQQQKKGLMQRLLTGEVRVVPGKGQTAPK